MTNENLKTILDQEEEDLRIKDPVEIAFNIAKYAHRNQSRINGDPYFTHPLGMLEYFRNIFCNSTNPYKREAIRDNGIPYIGVQEVILLHDVLEDCVVTLDDIRNEFKKEGFEKYFDDYISKPLRLITHDKQERYEDYICKLMTDPVASLVKMLDLQNNLDLLKLTKFEGYEYDRATRYVKYFKMINDKYHYVEKIYYFMDDIK